MPPRDEPSPTPGSCELCEREVPLRTRHHLIPRTRHRRGSAQRTFDRDELRGRVALLCKPCHKQVHALIDVVELEQRYNTLEALRGHPAVARFLTWIRLKPGDLEVTTFRSRERRGTRRRGPR